jgi:thiamine biosynthesis lipoprotein
MKITTLIIWLGLLTCTSLLTGCGSGEIPVYSIQFTAFDQKADVSILGAPLTMAETHSKEVATDIQFFASVFDSAPTAPLGYVNRFLATQQRFAAPPSCLPLLERCQQLSEQSQGLFNPAFGAVSDLWHFQQGEQQCFKTFPDPIQLQRLVAYTPKLTDISIDDIFLHNHNAAVRLDLRQAGPAFAIDTAIDYLREQGIRNAVIKIGDQIRLMGTRAGEPWRFPVRYAHGSSVLGTLNLSGDMSIVTVATYQTSCLYQNRLYHQVFDPRTGYPAQSVKEVTVFYAGDTLTATAAAMAFFVAGTPLWQDIAQQLGVTMAILTDAKEQIYVTPALAARLSFINEFSPPGQLTIGWQVAEKEPKPDI